MYIRGDVIGASCPSNFYHDYNHCQPTRKNPNHNLQTILYFKNKFNKTVLTNFLLFFGATFLGTTSFRLLLFLLLSVGLLFAASHAACFLYVFASFANRHAFPFMGCFFRNGGHWLAAFGLPEVPKKVDKRIFYNWTGSCALLGLLSRLGSATSTRSQFFSNPFFRFATRHFTDNFETILFFFYL